MSRPRPSRPAAAAAASSSSEMDSDPRLPESHDPTAMALDLAAISALNLFPIDEHKRSGVPKAAGSASGGDSDPRASLFGILNNGRTPMGSILLREWLKAPRTNESEIGTNDDDREADDQARRHNYVELLVTDEDLFTQLYKHLLSGIGDVNLNLRQLMNWKSKSDDGIKVLLAFYKLVQRFPNIIQALARYDGPYKDMIHDDILKQSEDIIVDTKQFALMVEASIDIAAASRHEYRINPDADAECSDIHTQIVEINNTIDTLLSKAKLKIDHEGVRLDTTATNGRVFKIAKKEELKLRGISTYRIVETKKDGVYFTSDALNDACSELRTAESLYSLKQTTYVREVMKIAVSFESSFTKINNIVTEIDVFVGMAHAARCAPTPYIRPTMLPMGSGIMDIKNARHPCVESLQTSYIPNDVKMDKDKNRLQIMTGPNMAGKSTYIRMVGVLCVMAQIGSFIPADSATLTIVSMVMARVGAGDSAQQGVSTFYVEMREAAAIVNKTTQDSLVIIDELGRGTSTYDGFGLAWAIAEDLAVNSQCFVLFATHFAELPSLALAHPCVSNLHVTAMTSSSAITMMYQVKSGASDRSFGVHVAEVAMFPSDVVYEAREKAHELEMLAGAIDGMHMDEDDASWIMVDHESSSSSATTPASSQAAPSQPSSSSSISRSMSTRVQSSAIDVASRIVYEAVALTPTSMLRTGIGTVDDDATRAWLNELKADRRKQDEDANKDGRNQDEQKQQMDTTQ